ncbi:hypothetical protein [Fischerella sp. JS2]|uniref:hypothetical protein n=1 Tax=Fischerella sp. JS2 TaxID=2597771 RepID=UPI0028E549A0|nr:hypothetical protein [Fischerella sp. JS2]
MRQFSLLFNPARHYPLLPLGWNASKAQQTVVDIVNETTSYLEKAASFPVHPMDEYGFGNDLYFGTAGVLWAIAYLQNVGAIDSTLDVGSYLDTHL